MRFRKRRRGPPHRPPSRKAGSSPRPRERRDRTWRNKTWGQAEGLKETAARLDRLPPGVGFAATFPEPIAYDEARKLLVYRGFMCQGSFNYLRQFSNDPDYLAAL